MKLRVLNTRIEVRSLHLRMPFRYGITTMTETLHLILKVTLEIDGRAHTGFAADNLPPKWFTKQASRPIGEEVAEMQEVIAVAAAHAEGLGASESVFALWQELSAVQDVTAKARGWPPLLAGFGVSLVERAVMDAWCRAHGTPFARVVREGGFGLRLGEIYLELREPPAAYLPTQPNEEVIARHTVGLTDPLTAAEIAEAERVDDGLPQALEDCIRVYGLTHFKIKITGDLPADQERLRRLAALLASAVPDYAFTLDANENYRSVAAFRAQWEELRADPKLAGFWPRMIFVEQPLHREVALTAETAAGLLGWAERPPLIIDESEADLRALETALASGYAGTSHKNCKGVIRGIANACLIAHRRRAQPQLGFHLSGEDLTNLGPVALQQDLAVAATLGITHVERNGHHYFAGLREFPICTQKAVLAHHADLYREHAAGWPAVRIERGRIRTRSVVAAPFGHALADGEIFVSVPE